MNINTINNGDEFTVNLINSEIVIENGQLAAKYLFRETEANTEHFLTVPVGGSSTFKRFCAINRSLGWSGRIEKHDIKELNLPPELSRLNFKLSYCILYEMNSYTERCEISQISIADTNNNLEALLSSLTI